MAALTQSGEKLWWQIALVLGLVAMAIFANTIPNDYALDDELVTINHPHTSQGIKAIPEIFTSYYYNNNIGNYYEYRPVVLASFAIEHSLFGDNPHVSHAINVLLYGLTCVVLLFVIRSFQPEKNWLVPAIATLLFAAHPLHTEVVASIKNRDEIFSFLFGISALLWSLKFARSGRWLQFLLFVLFILFSVISKRSVLSYAFIIPLAASWFTAAGLARVLSLSVPLLLIVAFFSPIGQPQQNALLLGVIFVFPLMLWSFKQWYVNGLQGVWSSIGSSIAPAPKNSVNPKVATKAPNMPKGHIGITIGVVLLLLSSLAFTYLDLRALMCIALLLAVVSTYFAQANQTYLVLAAIFTTGLIASNFNADGMLLMSLVLLVGAVVYVPAAKPAKALGFGFMAVLLILHFIINLHSPTSVIPYTIVALILIAHPKVPFKWLVPALLVLFALIKALDFNSKSVGMLFCAALTLYYSYRHLEFKFIPLATLAGIGALFLFTVYPYQPKNLAYHNNLGAYYAQQPDPYGDGVKNVTDVVPGAGREVDFVENPLVTEKKTTVRIATAGKVMGVYAALMVLPLQLRYYYGFDQISIVGLNDPIALLSWLSYIALFIVGLWLYGRDRLLSFALLYLLIGLLFVSNLGVLLTGIVAERLVYGTSLAFCLIVALALAKLFRIDVLQAVKLKALNPLLWVALLVVFGLYTARSVARNMDWKDKLTLFTHDADISPRSAKAQQLAGYQYMALAMEQPAKQATYIPLAEKYLKNALAIAPKFHTAMFNLGYLYSMAQDCKSAIFYYESFMKVSAAPPELIFQYAVCLDVENRLPEAAQQYERSIAGNGYFLPAYTNLSYLYYRQGNLEKAIEVNQRAIALMPNEADPYINLGKTYLQLNQPKEAMAYFEKAQPLVPNDVNLLLTLWDLHSQVGDANRAQMFYNRALQLGYKPQ